MTLVTYSCLYEADSVWLIPLPVPTHSNTCTRTHAHLSSQLPSFRALSLRGIRASEDSLTYYLVNMHSSGLVSQGLPYTVNTCKGPRI